MKKYVIITTGAATLLLFSGHTTTSTGYGMMGSTWMHGGFMWVGWLFTILIFIALILLIIWLTQQIQRKPDKKKIRR